MVGCSGELKMMRTFTHRQMVLMLHRQKSKVGTREGDGDERKVASTVKPNKATCSGIKREKETGVQQ